MSIDFEVVNVVATAALDRTLNLDELSEYFSSSSIYDPAVYPPPVPVYIKTPSMKGKISIFSSGKMICVGTNSENNARDEIFKLSEKIEKFGIAKLNSMPKIENMVAVSKFDSNLDLEKISLKFGAEYEPEQFPGVIFRMQLSEFIKTTFLIFSSGKIVCVGLKKEEEISSAFKILHEKLENNFI